MKANKKTVLSTAAVLGVAALLAGGTIAYFTDEEHQNNSFTVGSVDITLYESQLHRQNSGRMGNFPALASDPDYCDWKASSSVTTTMGDSTLINGSYESARYCTPNMDVAVGDSTNISAVANGHTATNRTWGFSDATIIADANEYKAGADTTTDTSDDGYFTRVSQDIVPGQWVRKFAYVTNDGDSDAYVLIKYMVPTEYADKVELKVPGTPYGDAGDNDFAYFTAVKKSGGKYVAATPGETYTETVDGTEYKIYAAVTNDVVKSGEMTFWSPVNTVRLIAGEEQTKDDTTGAISYPLDAIDVKVDAQAIQARTFADAIEAINSL